MIFDLCVHMLYEFPFFYTKAVKYFHGLPKLSLVLNKFLATLYFEVSSCVMSWVTLKGELLAAPASRSNEAIFRVPVLKIVAQLHH